MEREIIYRKVYIKSEDDLPKESGVYYVGKRDFEKGLFHFDPNGRGKLQEYDVSYWIEFVEFYLLPVELPTEEEIIDAVDDYGEKHQEDKYGYSIYGITSNAYSQGIRWLLNKILGK